MAAQDAIELILWAIAKAGGTASTKPVVPFKELMNSAEKACSAVALHARSFHELNGIRNQAKHAGVPADAEDVRRRVRGLPGALQSIALSPPLILESSHIEEMVETLRTILKSVD